MNEITVPARAKINIGLDVLGKRADGYHELRTVMQSVELADTLRIRKGIGSGRVHLRTDCPSVPADGRNLAVKAAHALTGKFGITDDVFIELQKRVPVAAGLGGGSACCAAVLAGMRGLWGLSITDCELSEIGLSLGADVPFCLAGGTCLAEGIGERLTGLRPLPPAWVLLAKPPVAVSTAEVFNLYDTKNTLRPDMERLLHYIEKNDLVGIGANIVNALEAVTARLVPEITPLKELMLAHGAFGASMSGSGPTVYGLFDHEKKTKYAKTAISSAFPQITEIFVTRTYNV